MLVVSRFLAIRDFGSFAKIPPAPTHPDSEIRRVRPERRRRTGLFTPHKALWKSEKFSPYVVPIGGP